MIRKRTFSQASVVHARVQELMHFSGVLKAVRSTGHWMRPQRTFAFGKELGLMHVMGVDSPYGGPWIVSQHYVEHRLAEHLETRGVRIEYGKELVGLEQNGNAVDVTLALDGGGTETLSANWVVGADGPRSKVRDLAGVAFTGKHYNEDFEFLIGDVSLPPTFPTDYGYTFLNKDGAILLIIPQYGAHRIVFSRPIKHDPGHPRERVPPTLEELQQVVSQYGPEDAILSKPTWLTRFGTQRKIADRLRVGRVFLAGDAAHAHIPLGGQGMNTGVSDAFNLGWKLALVVKGYAPTAFLDSYHAERHPVAEALTRTTDALFTRASRAPLPLRLWMSRVGPLVFNKPFVQRRMKYAMSQLLINYRSSAIVIDRLGTKKGPRGGERAPDADVIRDEDFGPERLFDLFCDPRHTLLLFSGPSDTVTPVAPLVSAAQEVRENYGHVVNVVLICVDRHFPDRAVWNGPAFRDVLGAAHKLYGARESRAYLIRPDGYVGFRADGFAQEDLRAYLRQNFLPASVVAAFAAEPALGGVAE